MAKYKGSYFYPTQSVVNGLFDFYALLIYQKKNLFKL